MLSCNYLIIIIYIYTIISKLLCLYFHPSYLVAPSPSCSNLHPPHLLIYTISIIITSLSIHLPIISVVNTLHSTTFITGALSGRLANYVSHLPSSPAPPVHYHYHVFIYTIHIGHAFLSMSSLPLSLSFIIYIIYIPREISIHITIIIRASRQHTPSSRSLRLC